MELYYGGADHQCNIEHDQCYWNDIQTAQGECEIWHECKYIYQTDKHTPATPGVPVYWARSEGEIVTEDGSVTWKLNGIIHMLSKSLIIILY